MQERKPIELPKRAKDITGKIFGWLTALYPSKLVGPKNDVTWMCQCKCGNLVEYPVGTLQIGHAKCCGKCNYRRETHKFNDLTGKRFGHLTVLRPVFDPKIRKKPWLCQCDCGNTIITSSEYLTRGFRKSCGCYNQLYRTKWKTEEEHLLADRWHRIQQRCYNPKDKNYARWGARGIKMCDDWLHDKNKFIAWGLATGFKPGMEIDRIDNSKGYSPDNCRWATDEEQANNRTNNRTIEVDGMEKSCGRWDKYFGLFSGYTWAYMNRNGKEAAARMIQARLDGTWVYGQKLDPI